MAFLYFQLENINIANASSSPFLGSIIYGSKYHRLNTCKYYVLNGSVNLAPFFILDFFIFVGVR